MDQKVNLEVLYIWVIGIYILHITYINKKKP